MSGDDDRLFTLDYLTVAQQRIPGPQAYWMRDWSAVYELSYRVVLARRPGIVLLINSGTGTNLPLLNAGIRDRLGPDFAIRAHPTPLAAQLRERGVAPEEVTHIVCTPLQGYATGGLLAFPRAQILFSRRGWLAFNTLHSDIHDDREKMFDAETLRTLVSDAWPRVRLLEDEDEIADGLRTWWSGSHHRSSIVVEIDSIDGPAAVGDCYFFPRNVREGVPPGMCESVAEASTAYERLRRSGRRIVSLYADGDLVTS